MIIKHERSTHTKTTNNVSYQQRMREHTQFRVHSMVGNTTMTVVLRPEKRRRICGQKELESCCFICSLSFRGCGVNECNERMRSAFPSQIVLHFQMGNDKSNPLQKDKHEPRNQITICVSLSLPHRTTLPRRSVKWR